MKKLWVISLLIFSLAGCAFLQNQKANWEACRADAECFDKAKSYQDKAENVATVALTAVPVPIPGGAAIPKGAGWIALAIAMLTGGSALRKKQAQEKPQ